MVFKNEFLRGALAYAEADIRIDRAWNRAKEILLEIFSSQPYLKSVCSEQRIHGMEWKAPGKNRKAVNIKKLNAVQSPQVTFRLEMPNAWLAFPYSPTGQVFTQYYSCGMIFRCENGDEAANIWRLHLAMDHTGVLKENKVEIKNN